MVEFPRSVLRRRLWLSFVLILGTALYSSAQTAPAPLSDLEKQLGTGSSVDQIKAVLNSADRGVDSRIRENRSDLRKVALEHLQLGKFRKHVFTVLRAKLDEGKYAKEGEIGSLTDLFQENTAKAKKELETAIRILENDLKEKSAELISAKFELARLIETSDRSIQGTPVRHKLDQLEKVQRLYSESVAASELIGATGPAETPVLRFYLARSLAESADFERALPHFEKFVQEISALEGEASPALVPALEMIAAIAQAAGIDTMVAGAAQRIEAITKKKPEFSNAMLNLTMRAFTENEGLNEPPFSQRFERPPVRYERELRPGMLLSNPRVYRIEDEHYMRSRFVGRAVPVVVTVEKDGSVSRAESIGNSEQFDKKAVKTVRQWKFRPFVINGMTTRMNGLVYYWPSYN